MLMKLVALLVSSFVFTAYAGEKPKIETCDYDHEKFIASKPAGFKHLDDKNEKVGARVTTIIAPDDSSVSIISTPAAAIPFFQRPPYYSVGCTVYQPYGTLK